jgi:hypothetical protein
MSELLDKYVPSVGAGAGGDGGASAFDQFLERLVPGDPPADEFKRELLYAAIGAALLVVAAVGLAALPSPMWVIEAGFFAVGDATLANIMGIAEGLVFPVFVCGIVMLTVTGVIALVGQRSEIVDGFCIGLTICGVVGLGIAIVGGLILLAAILVNLLFWLIVGTALVIISIAVVAVIVGMLVGAVSGSAMKRGGFIPPAVPRPPDLPQVAFSDAS